MKLYQLIGNRQLDRFPSNYLRPLIPHCPPEGQTKTLDGQLCQMRRQHPEEPDRHIDGNPGLAKYHC